MRKPIPTTKTIPRSVVILGFVSLFNDFASEMVIPLIPLLLATVLSAGPAILGLIEGIAEMVANFLKLWAGRRSDLFGTRRKPFVIAGYLLSNLVRPLIGFSGHWFTVLTIRVTDRVGKGVRSAPRDAMVADSVQNTHSGYAFGLIRALDHAGAVLGALAAAAILYWGTARLDWVIALSAIPGLLAVSLIVFAVKEPAPNTRAPKNLPPLRWAHLNQPTRRYLSVLGLFVLGRIPETFLLFRGHELGLDVVSLLLLWALLHTFKSIISEIGGRLADRYGRHVLIFMGWLSYAAALLGLGLTNSAVGLWGFSLVLAAYYGLSEGPERALLHDLTPSGEHGTAFGWYHMLVGLAAIPAGLGLGILWSLAGAQTAFLISAALAAVVSMLFFVGVRPHTA